MVLGEIDAAFNIWERGRNWFRSRRRSPESTVSERFLNLFEAHGVHRNQIPRFFGRGITLKHVQSKDNLIDALTEDALHDACDMFAVNRSWLDGASEKVYSLYPCYKRPKKFKELIDGLVEKKANCSGYLLLGRNGRTPKSQQYDAVLVIQEEIGYIDDKAICRYHLCDHWIFDYWKCRAYLAACVGYAWSREVYILGQFADRATVAEIAEGGALLQSHEWGGGLASYGQICYPEDLALTPEAFLQGLKGRDDSFGERKGLELWLELEDKGWMRDEHGVSSRSEFENKLKNLE